MTLSQPCNERPHGLDGLVRDVVARAARAAAGPRSVVPAEPVEELLRILVGREHAVLRSLAASLEQQVSALADRAAPPAWAPAVLTAVVEADHEVLRHLAYEEQILFPWLRQERMALVADALRAMRVQHGQILHALANVHDAWGAAVEGDPDSAMLPVGATIDRLARVTCAIVRFEDEGLARTVRSRCRGPYADAGC
jgi:iron-sulfur cluster repair protein YtfE (RIC family)